MPSVRLAFWGTRYPVAESEHRLTVDAWCARVPDGSLEALIQAFEAAFAALWQRSCLTLGEVTLAAIVERVLHTATEQFAMLGSMQARTIRAPLPEPTIAGRFAPR